MKLFCDDNGHDEGIMTDWLVFFYGEMGELDEEMVWRSCDDVSSGRVRV